MIHTEFTSVLFVGHELDIMQCQGYSIFLSMDEFMLLVRKHSSVQIFSFCCRCCFAYTGGDNFDCKRSRKLGIECEHVGVFCMFQRYSKLDGVLGTCRRHDCSEEEMRLDSRR